MVITHLGNSPGEEPPVMSQTSDATLKARRNTQGPAPGISAGGGRADDAGLDGARQHQLGSMQGQESPAVTLSDPTLEAPGITTMGHDLKNEEGEEGGPGSVLPAAAAASGGKIYVTRRQRRRVVQWMGGLGRVCCVCSTPQPMASSPGAPAEGYAAGAGVRRKTSWTAAFRTKTPHVSDGHGGGAAAAAAGSGNSTGVGRAGNYDNHRVDQSRRTGRVCGTCAHIIDPSVSVDGLVCKRDSTTDSGGGVGGGGGGGGGSSRSNRGLLSFRRLLTARDDNAAAAAVAAVQHGEARRCGHINHDKDGSSSSDSDTETSADESADTLAWISGDDSSRGNRNNGGRARGKPALDLDDKAARLRRAQKLLNKSGGG